MSWIDMDDETYDKFMDEARKLAVWDHKSGSYVTYPSRAGEPRKFIVMHKWGTERVAETEFETREAAEDFVRAKRDAGFEAYVRDNLYSDKWPT
jgi:hypothetical protein